MLSHGQQMSTREMKKSCMMDLFNFFIHQEESQDGDKDIVREHAFSLQCNRLFWLFPLPFGNSLVQKEILEICHSIVSSLLNTVRKLRILSIEFQKGTVYQLLQQTFPNHRKYCQNTNVKSEQSCNLICFLHYLSHAPTLQSAFELFCLKRCQQHGRMMCTSSCAQLLSSQQSAVGQTHFFRFLPAPLLEGVGFLMVWCSNCEFIISLHSSPASHSPKMIKCWFLPVELWQSVPWVHLYQESS